MSSVALLLGLLVVAYVGSHIISGKAGLGLASGAEYLLLGLAIGPHALRLVSRPTLVAFSPVALVGAAWVTLVIGAEYGFQERRRVSLRGFVAGVLLSSASLAATAGALHHVLSRFRLLSGHELLAVSVGVGLVSSETTRHAVRWVLGRHSADGPLARLVGDLADCDDAVPIVGVSVLSALAGNHGILGFVPLPGLAFVPLGLGLVLGVTAAALLRAELKASDGWGVLIGAALVTAGTASRVGLSALAGTFALGLSLALVSRHRRELRLMLRGTEQAVILPLMLLAGALVPLEHRLLLGLALGLAFTVRLGLRLLVAPVLTALARAPAAAAPSLSLGLLPSGALSVMLGVTLDAELGGTAGGIVLGVSVGLTLIGELLGPAGLRRALAAAGEIGADAGPAQTETRKPEPST